MTLGSLVQKLARGAEDKMCIMRRGLMARGKGARAAKASTHQVKRRAQTLGRSAEHQVAASETTDRRGRSSQERVDG